MRRNQVDTLCDLEPRCVLLDNEATDALGATLIVRSSKNRIKVSDTGVGDPCFGAA